MSSNPIEQKETKISSSYIPLLYCHDCKGIISDFALTASEGQINVRATCTSSCENKEKELILDEFMAKLIRNQTVGKCKMHFKPSSYYCKDCLEYLCNECLDYHKLFSKEHKSITPYESTDECMIHNKDYSMHCLDCNVNLCNECQYQSDHRKHRVISNQFAGLVESKLKINELEEIITDNKQRTKDLIKRIDEYIQTLKQIKKDITSAWEHNQLINNDLRLFYQSIEKTAKTFKNYDKLKLKQKEFITNKNQQPKEVITNQQIEEENKRLTHYFSTQFVFKIDSQMKEHETSDNTNVMNDLGKTDCSCNETKKSSIQDVNDTKAKAINKNENKQKKITEIQSVDYPSSIKLYIVPSSQLSKTVFKTFKLYYYYQYHTVNDIYLLLANEQQIKNHNITLWKLKIEGSRYSRQSIAIDDNPIPNIVEDDTFLVCEYQNKYVSKPNQSLKELSAGKKGLVGLDNLGNTCYMNAALQSLSNCDLLTEYFLKYYDKKKINQNNKNGTKGRVANAYQTLIEELWKGNSSSFQPNEFKQAIASVADIFRGYNQQDSFELLTYTLNAINEDINLVLQRDSSSIKLKNNKPTDPELAKYQWDIFHSYKQSIIIDLFYGMYKTIIYCPQGCEIKKFETFHALPLLLNVCFITCVFVYYDISIKPVAIKIPFESDKTFGHLRNEISELFEVNEHSFVFANVYNEQIIQLFNATTVVTPDSEVYCFQIDPEITKDVIKRTSIDEKPKDELQSIMKKNFLQLNIQINQILRSS